MLTPGTERRGHMRHDISKYRERKSYAVERDRRCESVFAKN